MAAREGFEDITSLHATSFLCLRDHHPCLLAVHDGHDRWCDVDVGGIVDFNRWRNDIRNDNVGDADDIVFYHDDGNQYNRGAMPDWIHRMLVHKWWRLRCRLDVQRRHMC